MFSIFQRSQSLQLFNYLRLFHMAVSSHFEVHLVPCLEDNYAYILVDTATRLCAAVDPVTPEKVLAKVRQLDCVLSCVLTTHHHYDHAGGNRPLLKQLDAPIPVYGGDDRVDALSHKVTDGDTIDLGASRIKVYFTPCHTTGHVIYHVGAETPSPALFTGDTLFVGGCGRFFEGNGAQMHHALNGVIKSLPHSTRIYCGHEYTIANLQFAASLEPHNAVLASKLASTTLQRQENLPTIPSLLSEELEYNPFMRLDSLELLENLGKSFDLSNADDAFKMECVRNAKNNFKSK